MRTRNRLIGHLHDDLTSLAGTVQMTLIDGHQTIWAEDDGRVYACAVSEPRDLPVHWIAGTFGMGQPLKEIEEDLRALLRERCRDWIVD